ncbi:MAG: tetratricopeptide repeat protein, partial [Gemmatimonadota bacterium]
AASPGELESPETPESPAKVAGPGEAESPAEPAARASEPTESGPAAADPDGVGDAGDAPMEEGDGSTDDSSMTTLPVVAGAQEAEAGEEGDELQGHFFRARLAQYRIRRAEERHTVDHAAHLDLATAYIGMELHQEALRELRVALEGSRTVSGRAARLLKRIALSDGAPPDLALEILERLAEQPSGATAETLGAQLADAWGDDHPLAERLAEIRRRLSDALEELPALEDMFPALEASERAATPEDESTGESERTEEIEATEEIEETEPDHAGADGVAEPVPESGGPPDVAVSPVDEADRLLADGEMDRAKALLRSTLEELDEKKRTHDGLAVLDRLLELEPDDVELHERRVEMAVMVNDQELVARARAELGDCLRRRGESARARAAYGHVLDTDPDDEAARAAIEAIDAEELALEQERSVDRPGPSADEELAEVEALLDGLGVSEEAEDVVVVGADDAGADDAESTEDPTARSRYELGLAFRQMGMWDEAVRELRPALGGVVDRLAALEALGECLVRGGRSGEAVGLLRENLRSDEDAEQVGPLYYLGLALAEEGDEAEARKVLGRVDAARPGYRDVQARLSELSL